MKYMPDGVGVIKDNLFYPPEIFRIIQQCSGADDKEMYQVFNMGCRLEVYTSEKAAQSVIDLSKGFGIDAQIIGRVEPDAVKKLQITLQSNNFVYYL
jgi:phosphoribosylformylglycinamidine cyclo-ligase